MPSPIVFVGTPCYGGVVTELYMHSVISLLRGAHGRELQFVLRTGHDSLITRSRNTIAAAFLDLPEATHLMFIDADIGFHPDAFFRLLDFDVDLCAGMYPLKFVDWAKVQKAALAGATLEQLPLAALRHVGMGCAGEARKEKNGFVTGEQAGCGFMLIKRAVLEKMAAAHPELKYGFAQVHPIPAKASGNQHAFFECAIDPASGAYLSEDFAFCQRWRKMGGELWLDSQTRLLHQGIQTFGGQWAAP